MIDWPNAIVAFVLGFLAAVPLWLLDRNRERRERRSQAESEWTRAAVRIVATATQENVTDVEVLRVIAEYPTERWRAILGSADFEVLERLQLAFMIPTLQPQEDSAQEAVADSKRQATADMLDLALRRTTEEAAAVRRAERRARKALHPFRNVRQRMKGRRQEAHREAPSELPAASERLMRNISEPRRSDVKTVEIVGGPEAVEVGLHDYEARWAECYLDHRGRILDALAAVNVEIEHIGSTSVPGLAAKPIVDIVVTVPDITAEEDYLDPLLAAGYQLRVREPRHRLVRTPGRDVHVHLYGRGDAAVGEYLLLRDHLRTDADDRALYESVKRSLISQPWGDMNDYADAKSDVILAIKARARTARR